MRAGLDNSLLNPTIPRLQPSGSKPNRECCTPQQFASKGNKQRLPISPVSEQHLAPTTTYPHARPAAVADNHFRKAVGKSKSPAKADVEPIAQALSPGWNARELSKEAFSDGCGSPHAAKSRGNDNSDSEDDRSPCSPIRGECVLKIVLGLSFVTGVFSIIAVVAALVSESHGPAVPTSAPGPAPSPALASPGLSLRIPLQPASGPTTLPLTHPGAGSSVESWKEVTVPGGSMNEGPLQGKKLTAAGHYDLRAVKGGRLLGCAAPVGMFPGQPKYGCAGDFATAQTCDAAANPIKDTDYVSAVHQGCDTEQGHGTYGYAYDDGNGLKQCAPMTKYEWILCPSGTETKIQWASSEGLQPDSPKRFRVTNKCDQTIWIQNQGMPHEQDVIRIASQSSYTYSIPNEGLPSTRFLPKVGCGADGNGCDVQSLPPCPAKGCDLPIDTKFEASWGCLYAKGTPEDTAKCPHKSTYQDWWDGSAVDGWTLPFSVLVDDGGHGLQWNDVSGSPKICSPVICARLDAATLCPQREFLTPES